jgi:hypothetical protein
MKKNNVNNKTIRTALKFSISMTIATIATLVIDSTIATSAQASIIGDFGAGYQYGKNLAYQGYGDYCPNGYSNSYCAGFHVGWNAEEAALQQAQP